MKILIADDSAVIVQRLVTMLTEIKGIEIADQVATVGEASTAVASLRPDVVILDMQMPGGTGLDVLKSMQEHGVLSTVIVLTNFAYPQMRKRCLQNGAEFFFDKSSEFERVGEVLQGLMDKASENTGLRNHEPDEI
jgi:DNA-binding NarL/FixJ family response regulator